MQSDFASHRQSPAAVFAHFNSGEAGLSHAQVVVAQKVHGRNDLPVSPAKPAWKRFLLQFHNLFIYVLIASGLISLLVQHYVDSGVIVVVIFVNAIVGFIQEGKAEDALQAIMSMTKTYCLVVREGELDTVDSRELVPGDVVLMEAGDRVPADIRLFFCKDFRCDESPLTGEAQPVSKHMEVLSEDLPLAERKNMSFMGTMVTFGVAKGIVTATGLHSQIGQISKLVSTVKLVQTPLQQQLARFASQLTGAIIIVALITVLLGVYLHSYTFEYMLQAAIGIAVSSIPEGLPAIVTIALAIGVQRMATSQALVRRLPAVEVLGSVDVICSDKTGTLTANAMTVRAVQTANHRYRISGEGYKPHGSVELTDPYHGVVVEHDKLFTQACQIAMLCNDARVEHENQDWILHGDPTEGALLVLAMKCGLTTQELNHDWTRIDVLPFESDQRYMATLHHSVEGKIQLLVKGAPEKLLDYATQQFGDAGFEPLDPDLWRLTTQDFAKRGMRVLGLAMKLYKKKPDVVSHAEVESDLIMVGLVGISDPPTPEAISSVRMCHSAGIKVKMITGDNPITAKAVGSELGLDATAVITGLDIDNLSETELAAALEHTDIFARTSPKNKLQLVNALQCGDHVVAMTGDGVNDAPALKKADIGVAMGRKGTDAAKEAADFVLVDDNFSTISKAVSEGRTVYDNILKSIIFILPTNLAEALVIFIAVLLGRMMPITPAQILWVNMITAITLALALVFEQPEKDVMTRVPRKYGQGLLSRWLLLRMCVVAGLGAVVVFALFFYYRGQGASIEYARTIAVNSLVMVEVFYLFTCRWLGQTIFSREFFSGSQAVFLAAAAVVVLQFLFSYLSVSQSIFGLESIVLKDWMLILLTALPVVFVVELEKALQRRLSKP